MQLTNEEAAKLMKQIQPHISGFSYILQKDGEDGQEVVCGGKLNLFLTCINTMTKQKEIFPM